MTVSTTSTFYTYTRNGTTTVWSFPNKIISATDLVVTDIDKTQNPWVMTVLVLNTDYTVQNVDNDLGATVITTVPGISGHTLDIRSVTDVLQTTSIKNQGSFLPELHEDTFDKLTRSIQDQRRRAHYFGVHAQDVETVPWPAMPLPSIRANTQLIFDANGLPAVGILSASTVSQSTIIGFLGADPIGRQTAAELGAGITPTNLAYPFGDLRRYGADPTGVADSSSAWQSAITLGRAIIASNCSYKILTGAATTGQVTVTGQGKTSKLLSDVTVVTVTNGTGSLVDNLWMENITAPWIITRNPANWSASVAASLQQSNTVLGYQPTSNDTDIWSSLTSAQQNQNIGPTIQFTGAATDIEVSRIYGRFIRVTIQDATDSTIHDCTGRGGKGNAAALFFDNATNNVQRGSRNRIYDNRILYSSFSGAAMTANDDGEMKNNTNCLNGESGTKTFQAGGIAFVSSVGGLTSGTLSSAWTGGTAANWNIGFADGEVRTNVSLTNGSTAISWTGALAANNILNAAVWGVAGFPSSNMDPRCGRIQIEGNHCNDNYYDAMDCGAVYNVTNDSTRSQHQIVGNWGFRNRGAGINLDGQQNTVVGNHLYYNGTFGIWGICSDNNISANTLIDNNQSRVSSQADILAVGAYANNKIADNKIYAGPGQNNFAIQVTPGATNFITDNVTNGTFSFGNIGQVSGVVEGNIDSVTGPMSTQSFCFQIVNNGGTLQHIFYADASGGGGGLFGHVLGATSGGFTTTPTGTDASTAFAAGAKIGSVSTNVIFLNTAAQSPNNSVLNAPMVFNNTGTEVRVAPIVQSLNINGVTQYRLAFQFTTASGNFALNTTNIPAGKGIYIQFYGKLA